MQRGLIRRGRTQMLLPRVITYHSHGLQLRAASPFQSTKGDEVAFGENGTYNGYRFTERAVDVIERHDSQEPLFLYLALHNTHGPIQAPDRFVELYDFEQQKRNHFNAMVSVVDSTVANVTAALHRRGLYDNTLIVWAAGDDGVFAAAQTLSGHTSTVMCVTELDDRRLVSGSTDHTLKVWE